MKKLIAIAAITAGMFAVPALPVQAASDYPSHCLVLPLLQADCVEVIRDNIHARRSNVAAATKTALEVANPLPWPWECTRAPKGSGHLYDCN